MPLRLRRPTAVIGVSVGELYSPQVIDAVSSQLERVDLIAARDLTSAARLSELSGRAVVQMGDLALEAVEPLAPTPMQVDRPRIGVATRAIIGRGPSVPDSASSGLRLELARALDRIVHETGAGIELVPFRTHGRGGHPDDDVAEGERLAAHARTGADWVCHAAPTDASAFRTIATSLDLILAVRLHGAVLGAAVGRRIVGIAYDPKVDGFLDDLGLGEQVVPVTASAAEIAECVLRSLGDAGLEDRVRTGVLAARAQTRALDPELRRLAGR